jgi:hypothetical protein
MTSIPSWITPAGFLFTATELVSTATALVASGTNVGYTLLSGSLPNGLLLASTGTVYGTPTAVVNTTTNKFVVRASSTSGVVDRTFSIDVTGRDNPTWSTVEGFLTVGVNQEQYALDNQWVDYQLTASATEAPTGTTIAYYIPTNGGRLPPGLSMDRSGRITGYVNDTLTYDSFISDTGGYDDESYDSYTYDHDNVAPLIVSGATTPGIPKIYRFRVVATDGITNSERTFKIMVSSTEILYNNASAMTVTGVTVTVNDRFSLQSMQWLNGSDLGVIRAGNNHQIPVTVYDPAPYVGTVTYSIITGSSVVSNLPEGLSFDTEKGYIYGYVPYQPAYTRSYSITVKASKEGTIRFNPNNPNVLIPQNYTTTTNAINTFTLAVKGEVESTIEWVSTGSVGNIELGITSELAVVAKQLQTDYSIKYSLVGGSLPVGLTLERDGSLSGQVAYTANTGTYSFTVAASDVYELSTIEKQFTLSVVGTKKTPTTIYKTVTTYSTTSTYHSTGTSTKVVLLTSGTTWIVPADFSRTNTIEIWGPGAAGLVDNGHFGGGGGGYAKFTNLWLSSGTNILYHVGVFGEEATIFGSTIVDRSASLIATSGAGIYGGGGKLGDGSTGTYYQAVSFGIGGEGGTSSADVYGGGGVGGGGGGGSAGTGTNGDNIYGIGGFGASSNILGSAAGVGGYGGRRAFYISTGTNNDVNGAIFGGGGGAGGIGQGAHYAGIGGQGAILVTYTYTGTETTSLIATTSSVAIGTVTYTDNTFTKIYAKPFFTQQKRDEYRDFISNLFTFDPKLIYRYFDTNFGVQHDIKLMLEFGIEKINLDDYMPALRENFYRKKFYFGDVKKAVAADSTGSIIYEVIYVDIIDELTNNSGVGVSQSIENGADVYYPGSLENMRKQLEVIQLQNGEAIKVNEYNEPKFMRTPQAGDYRPPNYIRAVPLCYALPGQGDKIISRIKLSGFDFKLLDFEVDRLIVQETADSTTAKYLLLERQSLGDSIASDKYLFGTDWWQFTQLPTDKTDPLSRE